MMVVLMTLGRLLMKAGSPTKAEGLFNFPPVQRRFLMAGAVIATLAIPFSAHAQGVIRGMENGAADGSYHGTRVAGPVGGAVGGAVGAGVGGIVGGVNGVLGIHPRHYRRHHRHY
jgi:hypothetical protein